MKLTENEKKSFVLLTFLTSTSATVLVPVSVVTTLSLSTWMVASSRRAISLRVSSEESMSSSDSPVIRPSSSTPIS